MKEGRGEERGGKKEWRREGRERRGKLIKEIAEVQGRGKEERSK
jgi:hypothetical protein